jgi:hypothetical protein
MCVLFENAFSRADKEIPFDPKWEGPPNRYKNAVSGAIAPRVDIGRTVCSTDEKGLKYIFIGTRFGNIIVYEPFSGNETDPIYRIFLPSEVESMRLFHGYQLTEERMVFVFGGDNRPNVGIKIELMLGQGDQGTPSGW